MPLNIQYTFMGTGKVEPAAILKVMIRIITCMMAATIDEASWSEFFFFARKASALLPTVLCN
jgi:hypothetical protein